MAWMTSALVSLNRTIGRTIGWQLRRYQADYLTARQKLVTSTRPEIAVDGGANQGSWSLEFRKSNPSIPILAFEPVSSLFTGLASLEISNFSPQKFALSDSNGTAKINVASNDGMSSSIQTPTGHLTAFSDVTFNHVEDVEKRRLDSFPQLLEKKIWLKLDLQGHEWHAIQGSLDLIENVVGIEMETSLRANYENEKLHYEMVAELASRGFEPFHLFCAGVEEDGRMNYVDVIFRRVS